MKILLLNSITAIILMSSLCCSTNADECNDLDKKLSEITCEQLEFNDYYKCVKEKKEIRRKRQAICPITGLPINQVIDPIIQSRQSFVAPIYNQAAIQPVAQPYLQPAAAVEQVVQPAIQQVIPAIVQPQAVPPQVVEPIMQNQPVYVPPIVTQNVATSSQQTQNQAQFEQPRYILQSGDTVNRDIEIVGADNTTYRQSGTYPNVRNITTVIKLNNFINNTNHINMPTHINTTNINDIKIFTNTTDKFGLGSTEKGPCCFAVQPKRCHTSPMGPRCHHKRHKTCGQQCTSKIIHVVRGQHCGRQGCDINYIPQPSPKCIYTDDWPYVNCGHRRRDPCDGCYDYSYNYAYAPPAECNGCYDDGFEYGQMYRRGPVLRPFYQPQPPCQFSGDCDFDYDNGSGLTPDIYEDSENNNSTEIENDLGMVLHKCRVVSDDGSISIRNCTADQDNPYASAPSKQEAPRIQRSYIPPPMPYYSGYYAPPPPPPPMYGYGYPYYDPYAQGGPPMMRQHHRKHHNHRTHNKEETYIPPRPIEIINDDDDEVGPIVDDSTF